MERMEDIRKKCHTIEAIDIGSLLSGTCFFASGGGGSIVDAQKMAQGVSTSINIVPPSIIPDYYNAAIIADIGSPNAISAGFGMTAPLHAFDDLNEYCQGVTKLPLSIIVPVELGAISTLIPLLVASKRENVYVVDGDPCGRAVPQLSMTIFDTAGLPAAPFVLSSDDTTDIAANKGDHYESFVWVKDVEGAENCARCAIASDVYNEVGGLGCYLIKGRDINKPEKNSLFYNTLQMSIDLGQALAVYNQKFTGPVDFLTRYLRPMVSPVSYWFVTGKITNKKEVSGGFDIGQVTIDGEDGYQWVLSYMNESLYIQKNGATIETHAMGPDIICYIAEESYVGTKHILGGQAFSNADIASSPDPQDPALIPWGTRVSVFGIKCQDLMRQDKLVTLFNGAIDTMFEKNKKARPIPDYVPIEILNK